MKTITIELKGTCPMLMHAPILSNPLDQRTKDHKALTSDRALKKTDEGQLMIAKSEYISSCYTDSSGKVCIPMLNVRKSLIMGARFTKEGKEVEKYVFFDGINYTLKYKGPKTPEALWNSGQQFLNAQPVKVGQAMIMRYRPEFKEWSLTLSLTHEETEISQDSIMSFFEKAGNYVGLGDFRPLFGRYSVKLLS